MVTTRSFALATLSIGALALQASAQICYRYTFESNGVDYVGNDIANVQSESPYDCCGFCADQLACNAFTWTNYQGGTCWLKSSKGETRPSDGTTISAYDAKVNASSTCPNLLSDVAYTGTNLATVGGIKSAGDCCIECAKKPECATFTWNPRKNDGGSCDLQKSVGATTAKAGSISGGRQVVDPKCPPIRSAVAYSTNYLTAVRGVLSAGECCSKCQQNAQCTVFTWNYNSGYLDCNLHTAGAQLVASGGSFSGVPDGKCSTIEENVDYGGADISNVRAPKAENCCGICSATSGCGAYSWSSYNAGTCWLKAGKGSTTARSGVRSAVVIKA